MARAAKSNTGDERVADEIANDVWLAIARGVRALEDPACFPRWAFRIVDHRCADWIRQRALSRKRETLATAEVDRLAPAGVPAPGHSDETVRLREAIGRLPVEERRPVELDYEYGRSICEIAEVLAIPSGTVKSRLFSVRETLKQILKGTSHE